MRGNQTAPIPSSKAGAAPGWEKQNPIPARMPISAQTSHLEPREGGPAAPGAAGTHEHLQGYRGLQQERGCKSLCHGANPSSNATRNDKEHLKDFPPSTETTSQSRSVCCLLSMLYMSIPGEFICPVLSSPFSLWSPCASLFLLPSLVLSSSLASTQH